MDGEEALLQLSLSETENHILGTTALGFCVWAAADFEAKGHAGKRIDLKLPTGVRNISVRLLQSNSIILSKNDEYAVAGVRKNLYVWKIPNGQLVKILDAHFGRILAIVPYTVGPWNSVYFCFLYLYDKILIPKSHIGVGNYFFNRSKRQSLEFK